MNWFIFWCVFLAILFTVGLVYQIREDNARKDINRDLRDEWFDRNTKK